ncbi:uncharacterized protein LOC143463468 [Clavelina lepadiformis]|uniref:uncharacterized protein LOC143463468 n=1 Tax=Clavelina lepadiformis TaxID=159417 RepID=UPI0040416BF2
MPSLGQPGQLCYVIVLSAFAGMGFLAVGIGTNQWIKLYGKDAVAQTEEKFKANSNMSFATLITDWPTYQTKYYSLVSQKSTLLDVIRSTSLSLAVMLNESTTIAPNTVTVGRKRRSSDSTTSCLDCETVTENGLTPLQMMRVNLTEAVDSFRQTKEAMIKIEEMNQTRIAIGPMGRFHWHGGLFSMCSQADSDAVCGPASLFKKDELDVQCKSGYTVPNATPAISTADSVLVKTRACHDNGLAIAVEGSVTIFATVLIAITTLSLLPTTLIFVMSFKRERRRIALNGVLIGSFFLVLGVIAFVFIVFYKIIIVWNFQRQGLPTTSTGISWILALIGAILLVLAGILSFSIRPSVHVAPK